MNQFLAQQLTEHISTRLTESGSIMPELQAKIQAAIADFFKTKLVVIWDTGDVISQGEEAGLTITEEEAIDVLNYLEREHDCTNGITWVHVDNAIEQLDVGTPNGDFEDDPHDSE